jgi:hypothetical protein
LLLSHLSDHHTVFAMDGGTGSVRATEASPLLRRAVVTFVEGPTQLTLPSHRFSDQLDFVLIDGPHGFPFPQLEYYYLYPHLARGALVVLDDIHIPTVTHLFEFLSADDMFELLEVVETTAFLRRTDAPTFPPLGDGWETQRFNRRAFEPDEAELVAAAPAERVDLRIGSYLDRFGPLADPLRMTSVSVAHDQPLLVTGWAIDLSQREPAYAVDLVVDGVSYRTRVRVPRPDVAAAYRDSAYLRSGFSSRLPCTIAPSSSHLFELRVVVHGGAGAQVATRLRFESV